MTSLTHMWTACLYLDGCDTQFLSSLSIFRHAKFASTAYFTVNLILVADFPLLTQQIYELIYRMLQYSYINIS